MIRTVEQEPRASLPGISHIARWRANHCVVAYEVGIPGKLDMGSIDAVVSTDDGASWGIPATIFDPTQRHGAIQFGYVNPVLYKPPGQGVIWCSAMRCPLNFADSDDSRLAAVYSQLRRQ